MKRKYNKPICLDTCIFNNIIGFDGEDSIFSKLYNRERLIKYIKHHGYNISDYNLYETLRRENWNDENAINNLLVLNSRVLNKLKTFRPEVEEIIKHKPNIDARNKFVKTMFENIVDFASEFYIEILIFPFLFVLYSILHYYKINSICFESETISNYVDKIVLFLKTNFKKELIEYGKYTKSNAQKTLNKYYLIINHLTIEWANLNVNQLYEKINTLNTLKDKELYNVISEYVEILRGFNFTQTVFVGEGRKKANNKDNLIYLMMAQEFNSCKDSPQKDSYKDKFSEFLISIFNVLYDSSDVNDIVKTYYEMNVSDFYVQHIIKCNEKQDDAKLLDFIDPNDLIDLCALSDSYEQGFLFVSNDSKINKVINKIYSKEQKEFINLFINYKFDD